ncbi:MAG: ATP-binding cassette domain-containing protein, partial [Alphaproteobacteria bacterium]|nr:ATP-binding cassette domain-containing protein [Alphaproteobacteria bacterium]
MTASLEVARFTVRHGAVIAVADASLAAVPGEITVVLGPNGAGKSSLLRGIMGLSEADGTVRLRGKDIAGLAVEARAQAGLAWVPEGRRVFPGMTVSENLEVAGAGRSAARRARMKTVTGLFPQLAERLPDRAWQLSGGQQQMLAIGRALMANPSVYLLDEPSLGLAPVVTRAVADAL